MDFVRYWRRWGVAQIVGVWQRDDAITRLSLTLLYSGRPNGGVWDDPSCHEQLPASRAPRLEPPFVQAQQIGVRDAGRSLADLAEHVGEGDELVGEFGKHGREELRLDTAQGVIRIPADA